jgi:hypothetical protein
MLTLDSTLELGGPDRPTVWPRMRLELRDWFRSHAGSLAPAYEGAVELLANVAFPGRVRFIAHAVRDIANRLVFAIDPQEGDRVQYEEHLDEIQKLWPSLDGVCERELSSPSASSLSIPWDLAGMIDALITRHRERRERPSPYELLFRFLVKGSPSPPARIDALVKEFKRTAKWFMAHAHFTAEPSCQGDSAPGLGADTDSSTWQASFTVIRARGPEDERG